MESREELGKLTEEQLDEIVHDMKAGEAAAINNAGKEWQIEFILGEAPTTHWQQPRTVAQALATIGVRPKAGTEWVNVYVRGGVAEVDRSSGVRVEVLDYDNDGCECDPSGVNGKPHSHEIFEAKLPLCKVCREREAVAGVYCQPCLDRETEDMTREELEASCGH